ncbi:alanyl-tRNA editing protein Aarsd1-B-like [Teleopsis dalmanni]|uniref:alanyl-tRNA editing protein Aarsd1-B-like n=1 Tax=Teleopsis dalmanni TaxID=139649 RepID=UPI0018CCF01A|nr:alanyl-tRNA editing protein Aarsd1-B-like [Teleopsis dalmanni]
MSFKCQEDSFLQQFETTVLSCERATLNVSLSNDDDGENVGRLEGYNVICEDTILFPKSDGLPCDKGTINGFPVRNVTKTENGAAVHFVEMLDPFVASIKVIQTVDWDRRIDYMQQHSGQHLITALFEKEYQFNTLSWYLGSDAAYIVLPGNLVVGRPQLNIIERKANDLICEGKNVDVLSVEANETPSVSNKDDKKFDTIEPPLTKAGLARTVRIDGIGNFVCRGMHVRNLSQLQCIKLLYVEKFSGGWRVHYVVGERIMRKLGDFYKREKLFRLALRGASPTQHASFVDDIQTEFENSTTALDKVLKDFTDFHIEKLQTMQPRPQYYCLHRTYGMEPDFINTFLERAPEDIFYFLTVSENMPRGGKGIMVLRGEPDLIQKFGLLFSDILDGEGSGEGNRFEGNIIYSVDKVPDCEALLEEHFDMID